MATKSQANRVSSFGSGSVFSPSNPYDPSNVRERLGTDAFSELFGDYWTFKGNQKDLLVGALNYDAELGIRDYENEYNSPLNKVQREADAGLNPDLLGIEGVSDSAASPASRLSEMSVESPEEMYNFISSVSSDVMNNALNIIDEIYGVENMALQNQSLDLSNRIDRFNIMNGVDNLAFQDTVKGSSVFPDFGDDNLNSMYGASRRRYSSPDHAAVKVAQYSQKAQGSSARRQFVENLSQVGASSPDDVYIGVQQELNEFFTGVQCYTEYLMCCSAASSVARQESDDSLQIQQNEFDSNVLSGLDPEKVKEVQNLELFSEKSFYEFQRKYYSQLSPSTAAAAANAVASYQRSQAQHDQSFIESVNVTEEARTYNAQQGAAFQDATTQYKAAQNKAAYDAFQREFFDKHTSDDMRSSNDIASWIFRQAMGFQPTGFNPISAGISAGTSMLAPYNSAAAAHFSPRGVGRRSR